MLSWRVSDKMARSALGWSQHCRLSPKQEQCPTVIHSGGYASEQWARVNYTV